MNAVMKHTKKEDAVSPVVGVMLMLVVTIVIAATVAAFATGMFSDTQAAGNAVIKLDSVTMATIDQNAGTPQAMADSYTEGYVDFGELNNYDRSSYGPYAMTFKHNGGDSFNVEDLTLLITYNGASYSTGLTGLVTGKTVFTPGDKLTLKVTPAMIEAGTLKYGLAQQSMYSGPNTYTWELKDGSNMVIASGKETISRGSAIAGTAFTLTSTASPDGITSATSVTFTVNAGAALNGKTVTLVPAAGLSLGSTTTGPVEDGTATIGTTPTATVTEPTYYRVYATIADGDDKTYTTNAVTIKINPPAPESDDEGDD